MNDKIEMLDDLPKFEASASFEEMLYGDMLAQMPKAEPVPLSASSKLWASLALAASLALGVWIGFGQGAALLQTTPSETEYADLNAYQDLLTEFSS